MCSGTLSDSPDRRDESSMYHNAQHCRTRQMQCKVTKHGTERGTDDRSHQGRVLVVGSFGMTSPQRGVEHVAYCTTMLCMSSPS